MSASTGEKLKKLRGDRSQKEVAEALGLSVSAYNMYENGQRIPNDLKKTKIAAYYNRSVQFLFFED